MCESEFHRNVSAKDKTKDINLNQLKLKVKDTYQKDEKVTSNFEPSDKEHVIHKSFLVKKISKKKVRSLMLKKITTNSNHTTTNSLWRRF